MTIAAREILKTLRKGYLRRDMRAVSDAVTDALAYEPPVDELESLRLRYRAKFGKKPDGRWGIARLKKELE